MGSIQVRKETGNLILDFYYQGSRFREQTALPDTPANRKKVQKLLDRIESEISLGPSLIAYCILRPIYAKRNS